MSWLKAIGKWLGAIIPSIFIKLVKMGKKPKRVHSLGGDKEARDANDDAIRDAVDPDRKPK